MTEVLIVEDNPDLQTLFSKIFRHAGYSVRQAHDGCAAQQCLIRSLPDVLLLDVNIPGLSDLELIQYVRKAQGNNHVKIVMVTGDHLAQRTEAADLADLFLLKQVNLGDLVAFSNRLTQSSNTSRQSQSN